MTAQQRQTVFGWLVSADLFLAAAGAGVFLVSFVLDILDKYAPVARIGAVLGPLMVLLGAFFLFAELGRKGKAPNLLLKVNFSSWLSRGTWILTVFILLGLAYALPAFRVFSWLPWSDAMALLLLIGSIAAVFAFLVPNYTGFLFGVVKGIPLWNNSALPVLFFLSGITMGIAVVLVIGAFSGPILSPAGFHQLAAVGIGLVVLYIAALGSYLEVLRHSGSAASSAVGLLKTPVFILGVVLGGIVAPLVLLAFSLFVDDLSLLSVLAGLSGILLLAGGFLQRYSIVRAGTYLPLYSR